MYNVMIVDDEPEVREGLKIMINWKEHGFNVLEMAENGREALTKLKRRKYDLVITDIRMSVLDGLELIHTIKEENPWIKFIIISGYYEFDYAQKAIEYGVKAYLTKPIIRKELIKHLSNIKSELDSENAEKRLLQKSIKIARDTFLLKLVNGDFEENKIIQQSSEYGICVQGECFCVALIEIDCLLNMAQDNFKSTGLIKNTVREVAERIISDKQTGFIYEDMHERLGVLFRGKSTRIQCKEIMMDLEEVFCKLLEDHGIEVIISLGNIVMNINDIKVSRKQAQYAMENRMINGVRKIIPYYQIESTNIKQIIEYIEQHYQEDISLKSVAENFYINPAYLGQVFKNSTGKSFKEYINTKRITMAKELLLKKDYKMYEIIEMVGYKSCEYFYRQFKRYEGISCAEYKEKIMKS